MVRRYLTALILLVLFGCGGGGGGTVAQPDPVINSVSGIAAVGKPLSGTVYLKDSSGTVVGSKSTGADGSYSFDVTGNSNKPFLLKAVGSANGLNYTLYSMLHDKETVNINPLTNLITARAAQGANLDTIYDNGFNDVIASAMKSGLVQAMIDVKAFINNLAEVNGSVTVDPITDSTYKADGTGLDALFDKISVTVASGSFTVKKANGETLANMAVNDITSATADEPGGYTITGKVLFNNAALSGVSVALYKTTYEIYLVPGLDGHYGANNILKESVAIVTAKTGFDGVYSLKGVSAGSYTVVPTLGGYLFTPGSIGVISISSDGLVYLFDEGKGGNQVTDGINGIIYNSTLTMFDNTVHEQNFAGVIPGGGDFGITVD